MSNRGLLPEPWLKDADVMLYHGDVLAVLRELPAESVDCVVTSPPYWGLRDYGTGAWEGGDEGCDHKVGNRGEPRMLDNGTGVLYDSTLQSWTKRDASHNYRDTCGKCGATRIDQQLGLEPTPECSTRGLFRLRSDLTEDQRAFVLRRLMGGEVPRDA